MGKGFILFFAFFVAWIACLAASDIYADQNELIDPEVIKLLIEDNPKVIVVNQIKQQATVFENGKQIEEFEVLTGNFDENNRPTTPPGIYRFDGKERNYRSREHGGASMPYSLFWDKERGKALHYSDFPSMPKKYWKATHGCINVKSMKLAKFLFNWVELHKTILVVHGERTGL